MKERGLALLLSGLLLTQLPIAALAAEAIPEDGAVASFEPLDSGVANQIVPVGTEESELNLPDELTATVYHVREDVVIPVVPEEPDPVQDSGVPEDLADQPEPDGQGVPADDGHESQEAPLAEDGTPQAEPEAEAAPGGEATTVAIATATEAIPVTWSADPAYDKDTPGGYVFTAEAVDRPLSHGVTAPAITVTVLAPEAGNGLENPSDTPSTATYSSGALYVGFAGHEWMVIGDKTDGVATGEDNVVTLLAKNDDFGTTAFSNGGSAYSGSTLQSKMESIYNGFSDGEKSLVLPRGLDDIAGSAVTDVMVWPLSTGEANSVDDSVLIFSKPWWLRSPGRNDGTAAAVTKVGVVYDTGYNVNSGTVFVARPALRFNLAPALFTSATSGADSKSSANVGGVLIPMTPPASGTVKYTMRDTSLELNIEDTTARTAHNGDRIDIAYTGATTGTGCGVSVLVCDTNGNPRFYGRASDCTSDRAAAGTASFILPDRSTLPVGDYKLLVFSEQANGDNYTDFAGTPFEIDLKVEQGGIKIVAGSGGEVAYTEGNGFTLKNSGGYTVSGTWIGSLSASAGNYQAVITVPSGVTASVTLDSVTIDVSSTNYACAFAVEAGGEANVTLAGANTLKSGGYRAGLEVPENATLTLTGGDGDSLEATGGSKGAGIGGSSSGDGGTITISGGTVEAMGRAGGAGIGGGSTGGVSTGGGTGSGGTVQISGQGTTVIASCTYGHDVGSGYSGRDSGSLLVTDGATLVMKNQGTDVTNPEYKDCTIIDKEGNHTVYDGAGVGATLWDGRSNNSAKGLGVSAGGAILITGDGNATLTIDVADVTVTSNTAAVSGPIIKVGSGVNNLTIHDLDLTARDGETALSFASDATLTVAGTCTVTGGADSYDPGHHAVYGNGNLTVKVGDASLTAVGGATTATDAYYGGYGIGTFGALKANVGSGGTLIGRGGDSNYNYLGGIGLAGSGGISIDNAGTVIAESGKTGGAFSKYGIGSDADITLVGSGTTTARGNCGISLSGVLTVDGSVTAGGMYSGIQFFNGNGYKLAGSGSLTANGLDGADWGNGVYVDGSLELAFIGSLTATGGSGTMGRGITVGRNLTVREAPAALDARPGTGTDGHAIHVNGTTDNQTGYFIPVNTTAPVVWTALGGTPAAPAASPSGGAYGAAQTVTLTCATPGAVIFYTLDGTDPTAEGALTYKAPVTVPLGGTLKACAAAPGGFFSGVTAETYTKQSSGGSSGGGSSSSYGQRTLTDKPTGVKVEGSQIHDSAVLTVKAGTLHKIGDAGCDLLRTAQQAGRVLSVYDVSLSRSFRGNVTISLPVEGRDGQTLTVAHCIDGKLTLSNVKVSGGFAAVKTDSLSPFAVLNDVYTQEALAAPAVENPFQDVKETDWYYPAVMYVYQRGLMNGTAADTFAPAEAVTRAQPPVILYRLEGSPAVTAQNPFADVRPGQWYAEGVTWAAGAELVDGYNATTYGPGDPVTREQLVTILYRYAQYKKWDVSVGENTNILSYTDAFDVSEWAVPAFQWACGAGIIQGDGGRLNPKAGATRAELAQMLQRLLDKYGQSAALPAALPEGSKARRVKVKKGDTLWALARKYNCTLAALVAANPIVKDPDFILPGWELKIP